MEGTLAWPGQGRRTSYPPLVPLRPGGSRPPFFLAAGGYGSEAEMLVYAKLARHLDGRRPFYGLRARGVERNQVRAQVSAAHVHITRHLALGGSRLERVVMWPDAVAEGESVFERSLSRA